MVGSFVIVGLNFKCHTHADIRQATQGMAGPSSLAVGMGDFVIE